MNEDHSKVLVVTNTGATGKIFTVKQGDRQFNYTLGAKTVATITWQ